MLSLVGNFIHFLPYASIKLYGGLSNWSQVWNQIRTLMGNSDTAIIVYVAIGTMVVVLIFAFYTFVEGWQASATRAFRRGIKIPAYPIAGYHGAVWLAALEKPQLIEFRKSFLKLLGIGK